MNEEKKLNKTEEIETEESGVKLTDEQLEKVTGGVVKAGSGEESAGIGSGKKES